MQTIRLLIPNESGEINPRELADFLYLFRATNLALNKVVPKKQHGDMREPSRAEKKAYRRRLQAFSPEQLNSLFSLHRDAALLRISRITHQSPIEITLAGCVFLIALSVAFSGGRIRVSATGVEAELNAFGAGVKSLLNAMGLTKKSKIGFGIRETTIKLSKEEYGELCRQDDISWNKGGFQRYLVELKHRVNKRTRELRLHQDDLERICRHKAHARRGGWQSRFKKIFGRHFPD